MVVLMLYKFTKVLSNKHATCTIPNSLEQVKIDLHKANTTTDNQPQKSLH